MKLLEGKAGVIARLTRIFPDREFFMRSNGQVKFLKISSKLQIYVVSAIAGAICLWLLATVFMLFNQVTVASDRLVLAAQQAKIESSESRVNAYRNSVDEVADDLAKRQEFLENQYEAHFGDESAAPANTATKAEGETAKTVRKISAIIPEAAGLAQLEARQLAFVGELTRSAQRRTRAAESAIRKFGLNPDALARNSEEAQGGPFLPFFSSKKEASLDARFEQLGDVLARMDALETGLVAIPSGHPTNAYITTSGFGYRRDPFSGRAAMHSGLDFKGPAGAPILAAADGKIIFAGRKSGYGNCIEVAHGNGLVTRYAHLSSFKARVGQQVAKGTIIGGMGSTGRSTGTHLHFEVRVNDRAVNPRPFLEANLDVLKIQASAERRNNSPRGQ